MDIYDIISRMKQVLLRLTEDEYELLAAHASKLGVAASRTATMAVVQMLQRLRMRHYQSDPLERGHRLIFKVLDALACKLRDDTGNPLAPEDAAAVIDGARDTLKSALVDAADQETHVLPLWAESAERAGIDWGHGARSGADGARRAALGGGPGVGAKASSESARGDQRRRRSFPPGVAGPSHA